MFKQYVKKKLARYLKPVFVEIMKTGDWGDFNDRQPTIALKVERLSKMMRHVVATPIDLVRNGDFFVYRYTEDLGYQQTPSEARGQKPRGVDVPISPSDPTLCLNFYEKEFLKEPPSHISYLKLVGAHLWCNDLDFNFVEVGSKEGLESIYMADFIRRCGMNGMVFAFEPAMCFPLLRATVHINKMADRIITENMAVGKTDSYTVMSLPVGHTEGGSAQIFDSSHADFFYRVVPICRLDTYFSAKGESESYLVKIDVEGFDADVIYGLDGLIENQVPALAFEYTMHVMRGNGINPADALLYLYKKGFSLFNCWHLPDGPEKPEAACLEELHPENETALNAFFKKVCGHRCEQTDILAISRNIPNYDILISKLEKMANRR